jgi:heptosyltransferase-2
MSRADPRCILVIRLSSLGDIVLATAVLPGLKTRFPGSAVTMVVKAQYADVVSSHPLLADVALLDPDGMHRGLRGLVGFARTLARKRPDLVIDLQANLRSYLLCALLRPPRLVRWDKEALRRRWLVGWTRLTGRRPGISLKPVVERYLGCLETLDVRKPSGRTRVYPSERHCASAETWLQADKETPGRALVALCPGAKRETKRWPAERFARLGDRLVEECGVRILLVGSPQEASLAERVQSMMDAPVIQAAGRTSIGELAALLERCQALVTNDTGPMHLAGAVGTPVVAFFGPTVPELGFVPQGPRDIVLQRDVPCRPCSLHGSRACPQEHFNCLNLISVDAAFSAVAGLVREPGRAGPAA